MKVLMVAQKFGENRNYQTAQDAVMAQGRSDEGTRDRANTAPLWRFKDGANTAAEWGSQDGVTITAQSRTIDGAKTVVQTKVGVTTAAQATDGANGAARRI